MKSLVIKEEKGKFVSPYYLLLLLPLSVFGIIFISQNSKVGSSSQEEVLGEDIGIIWEKNDIEICYEKDCLTVKSDELYSLYTGSFLSQEKVKKFVNERLVTYFEDNLEQYKVKNRGGAFYTYKSDYIPDFSTLYTSLKEALKKNDIDTSIVLQNKEGPGTDGKYAKKYIEVDNSQQKLYVWNNYDVVKTIELSPPRKGYEVYGVFPIVDKGLSPIAPGGKYMPYWMAFYHDPKIDSWYGLHALIWQYDDDGSKIYEPEENIGKRISGGCIRMVKEDAKYLYENFEIGDPILIHE